MRLMAVLIAGDRAAPDYSIIVIREPIYKLPLSPLETAHY